MADECSVFEMRAPRNSHVPIRVVPFLAKQQLNSGGELSAAFTKSTQMITVVSSVAGSVDFSSSANVDPTGSLAPFPIKADIEYDFDVRPGTKIYFA